jgi:predicted nucleic acid-binding protein
VEVSRAVAPHRAARLDEVLAGLDLVRMGDAVVRLASRMPPRDLRALDAIHLATVALLEDVVAGIVTYDARLASAAAAHGWTVSSPA